MKRTRRPDVFVGVDAGGSHTEAVAIGVSGAVLARAQGEAGAVNAENVPRIALVVARVVRKALRKARGRSPAEALVVGAAGAGRAHVRNMFERALKALKLAKRTRVTTDGEVALGHAFPEGPGIVLIAGTGSVAYGRGIDGAIRRAGGLGWQLGDEGSGYAMGRLALAVAGRAMDGRGLKTSVSDALLEAVGTADLDGLVGWAQTADRAAVAALAQAVMGMAERGDSVARQLVETAATDLALLAAGLLRQFGAGGPERIALAGSLLVPGSPVRASLTAAVSRVAPQLRLLDLPIDPALGAARLAARP